MFRLIFIASFAFVHLLGANEQKEETEKVANKQHDLAKLSESFGHLIGKNIDALGINFDLQCVIKGLEDSIKGKNPPLNEIECIQAISDFQEAAFKKQSAENLKNAEEFLKKNAQSPSICTIEEGKLQYKIEKQGTGAEVQPHFSPLIKYVGKFLDGTVFTTSKESELIALDESIAGFTKGLVGMKEGEKRTLYVHPDFGYGTSGYLPPNSLLTFEIELVKANAGADEALSTNASKEKASDEIALPELNTKARR